MQRLIQGGLRFCLFNKFPGDVNTLGPKSNSDLEPDGVQCSLLTVKFRDEPFRAALEVLPCHQGPRFLLALLLSYPRYVLQPQGLLLSQDGSYQYHSQERRGSTKDKWVHAWVNPISGSFWEETHSITFTVWEKFTSPPCVSLFLIHSYHTHNTSATGCQRFFSTPSKSLRCRLGILQFNSILTLSTWS